MHLIPLTFVALLIGYLSLPPSETVIFVVSFTALPDSRSPLESQSAPMTKSTQGYHASQIHPCVHLLTSHACQPHPKKPLLEKTKELRKQLKSLSTHEKIWNVPNVLTFSRLVAAPVVGYLILHDQHAWALGLFAYAGITDMVDGWIARRWQLQTVVGSVVDPMADKLLMAITVGCLAAKGALPGRPRLEFRAHTHRPYSPHPRSSAPPSIPRPAPVHPSTLPASSVS